MLYRLKEICLMQEALLHLLHDALLAVLTLLELLDWLSLVTPSP